MMTSEQRIELGNMLTEIDEAFEASVTPSPLRAECLSFVADNKSNVERLRATLAATVAWWIVKGKEAGFHPDVVDQIALQETQFTIALISRAMKARQGQPFSPARVAIVAYFVAKAAAAGEPAKADVEAMAAAVDDLASDIEKERDRLRELIEEIADMDLGDVEIEHRTIIDRCRAEVESWDAAEVPA